MLYVLLSVIKLRVKVIAFDISQPLARNTNAHILHLPKFVYRYGFIVMDGNGSLFGTLSGNTREILHKFTVDLPKKHGRGGQSALRFARLRMEKRHNYVRKVCLHRWSAGNLRSLSWHMKGL
jgi:hypothetical protein